LINRNSEKKTTDTKACRPSKELPLSTYTSERFFHFQDGAGIGD
jgi:hypothetical protein